MTSEARCFASTIKAAVSFHDISRLATDDLRNVNFSYLPDVGELEVLHGETPVHRYLPGDSFGESSLLFNKPRSSTVRCVSEKCNIHEMRGEDFMAVIVSASRKASRITRVPLFSDGVFSTGFKPWNGSRTP